jgi:hypothetical protein
MHGTVLVRCGEGAEETDAVKASGAFVLLHLRARFQPRLSAGVGLHNSQFPLLYDKLARGLAYLQQRECHDS